jgi:uncharacterized protein with von Willebrand factor type A (vWA) domain
MRSRLLDFVQRLRRRGVAVSVAETLDALTAVAAAGVERPVLREALAAALVKDEADRPTFDVLFDEAFPLVGTEREPGRKRRSSAASGGDVPTGRRGADGDGARALPRADRGDARDRRTRGDAHAEAAEGGAVTRAARRRQLMALPFRDFTGRDVVEARDLVRVLAARLHARLARRERRRRRGRVDLRRTIRAAIGSGGVPARLVRRGRRPARPDLVALCDLSGSTAAASELCLALIAPAADFFRRVHLFAYVDRLCPVTVEDGHVAPEGSLDLHARSDFGRVLDELVHRHGRLLGRGTLLLVLGDARNNRRPPHAELLKAARDRVQRLVWLVPEPRERWDTGDSVLARYAPACDVVVECVNLDALVRAVHGVL